MLFRWKKNNKVCLDSIGQWSVICYRWWSECAANWRDKWTKVGLERLWLGFRLERNKAVKEAREIRSEAVRMERG